MTHYIGPEDDIYDAQDFYEPRAVLTGSKSRCRIERTEDAGLP